MHLVTIKSHESIRNFRKYLTQDTLSKMGLSDRKNGFEIALVKDERVLRVLSDGNEVSDIESVCDSFLFVYELPPITQPSSHRHEMLQRVSHNKLSAVCNISVIDYPRRERTLMFPRFLVVSLDQSLIKVHLEIFKHIRYIFRRYLELKDKIYSQNTKISCSRFEQELFAAKPQSFRMLTLEKWDSMSLTEQYEMVFHPAQLSGKQKSTSLSVDPSRQKPADLPYSIRLATRRDFSKKDCPCLYCKRKQCDNSCPLPFNDRKTLR